MEIEMRGINKSFGNNAVLNNAGFVLSTGEIHALMGENGAGKSTLMKILTGVYTKDVGQVIVDGQEVCYKNAREAEKAGIVFIHQELNVLFDLTVEENMFLGKEIKKKCGVCDKKAMRREVEKILKRLGVEIDPGQRMEELSVGQQQCDIAMAGLTVSEDRKEYVTFSDTYYQASQRLITTADDTTFDDCQEAADVEEILNGLSDSDSIGVQSGTTGQFYVEGSDDLDFPGLPATCVTYRNGSLAVQDLVNGNLKYVIIDAAPAASITEAINAMQ